MVLFHHGQKKPWIKIPFPEEYRIGNVYTMLVYDINSETTEYGYIFDGPYEPEKGLLYDKNRVLLDPYAKSISGRTVWGKKHRKNKHLYDYVKTLIALRKRHPVIYTGSADGEYNGTGYPELSFHGCRAWDIDTNSPGLAFAYMYSEDGQKYGLKKNTFIYVAVNAHWEDHDFELPVLPEGYKWELVLESGGYGYDGSGRICLKSRSTAILKAN